MIAIIIFFLILSGCSNSCDNFNEIESLKKENDTHKSILLIPQIVTSEKEWDESIMKEFSSTPIDAEGFLGQPKKKKWVLQVINTGTKDIKNLKISYSIKAYKNFITYGEDESDITGYTPTIYKEVSKNINIDELNSKTSLELDIFYMGTFPMAKLTVDEMYCSKNDLYIREPFTLCYYDDEFDDLQDMQHLRELLGIYN